MENMNQRKRQITQTPEQGQERYDTFKKVLDRYGLAMENGFYLEAITLMESLIADRLECYLLMNIKESDYSFSTLERLIRGLRSMVSTPITIESVEAWKNQRNKLLHEMAKIEDGNFESFDSKYDQAKQCAEDGLLLFREIDKICRASRP